MRRLPVVRHWLRRYKVCRISPPQIFDLSSARIKRNNISLSKKSCGLSFPPNPLAEAVFRQSKYNRFMPLNIWQSKIQYLGQDTSEWRILTEVSFCCVQYIFDWNLFQYMVF